MTFSKNFYLLFTIAILIDVVFNLPKNDDDEFDIKAFSNCRNLHLKRGIGECCKITKKKIWGDLESSFRKCRKRIKSVLIDTTTTSSVPDFKTVIEMSIDEKIFPDNHFALNYYIPRKKKHDSFEKQCFLECVLKEEGLIINDRVDKNGILQRFTTTLKYDYKWRAVAIKAAEKCMNEKNYDNNNNNSFVGLCKTGSSEIFKYEYCTNLKHFYLRCSNESQISSEYNKFQSYSNVDYSIDALTLEP
ncbi:hypothetical protein Phum_PHUM338950 [Pediculus humanus corporis]|uniref:Uncharacterized protein n=1 Tax=Pediculus humanus subsp. corporis TaxID=121224 RepID=E0VNP3_PEDHC|nr:uncharacterized protein Phum_PHUM338950 [Pediculus humanus corporis]EEB14999.1 hypothetical protein Phum_PHUM338950 [Pediculus humanus corporis]